MLFSLEQKNKTQIYISAFKFDEFIKMAMLIAKSFTSRENYLKLLFHYH